MDDRELPPDGLPRFAHGGGAGGDAIERFGIFDPAKDGDGHGEDCPRIIESDQLGSPRAHRPDDRDDGRVDRDRLDRWSGLEGDLDDDVAAGEDVARRAGPGGGQRRRRREPVPAGDRDELRVTDRAAHADLTDHLCRDPFLAPIPRHRVRQCTQPVAVPPSVVNAACHLTLAKAGIGNFMSTSFAPEHLLAVVNEIIQSARPDSSGSDHKIGIDRAPLYTYSWQIDVIFQISGFGQQCPPGRCRCT